MSLSESIVESLDTMSNRALDLSTVTPESFNSRTKDAAVILNEWVLSDGKCLLTEYLNDTTHNCTDDMLYATITDEELTEGTFYFTTEAELPTDNN